MATPCHAGLDPASLSLSQNSHSREIPKPVRDDNKKTISFWPPQKFLNRQKCNAVKVSVRNINALPVRKSHLFAFAGQLFQTDEEELLQHKLYRLLLLEVSKNENRILPRLLHNPEQRESGQCHMPCYANDFRKHFQNPRQEFPPEVSAAV